MDPEDGTRRVAIEGVQPEVDGGRFPIKRVVGEEVVVEADVFADGHDEMVCMLLFKGPHEETFRETPMRALGNDRWRGSFTVDALGRWAYTIEAWLDPFATWARDLRRRLEAAQDVSGELAAGALLLREAAGRARGRERKQLEARAAQLEGSQPVAERARAALEEETAALVRRHPDRGRATRRARTLEVVVHRERAAWGAWYEMFPRSCAAASGRHGTFRDCEELLPYVAAMGFDVLYLPPIHPIGRTKRKGRNNSLACVPSDPGSPWAVGAVEGGHKAVHPELGNLEDFRRLLNAAREHGLELALDIALQCSPDHPYLREHPQWFRWHPDGTIRHAENPPKKYEDIVPLCFETEDWRALWEEMRSIFQFWVEQGVRIFRVDNPHTKPFAFWEWLIGELEREHPDVILLSEAFTRPKVMYRLAKVGFAQSYTYFAWRNTKRELMDYFTELAHTGVAEYFRPNLWPNTPDILTEYLQAGGPPAFRARLVLAATLGASYGIYGPAFELGVNAPRAPGSEEYADSEKYEIKHWNRASRESLCEFVARVNRIRRGSPALRFGRSLRFHRAENDWIIAYSKATPDRADALLVVVNLDPFHTQSCWLDLDLAELGLGAGQRYQAHDLLTDARFLWEGARNFVELDPRACPAHVFRLRRKVRTEQDFDYYL